MRWKINRDSQTEVDANALIEILVLLHASDIRLISTDPMSGRIVEITDLNELVPRLDRFRVPEGGHV